MVLSDVVGIRRLDFGLPSGATRFVKTCFFLDSRGTPVA